MAAIRVILADDHALMRAGLRAILGSLADVEVVADATDGREAVELCIRHRPDIVLLDVSMANLNGIGATEQIVKAGIGTRVIILSMFGSEEYVLQALRAGASGYILKGASTSELELAIRTVAGGETWRRGASTPPTCWPRASARCFSCWRRATRRSRSPLS